MKTLRNRCRRGRCFTTRRATCTNSCLPRLLKQERTDSLEPASYYSTHVRVGRAEAAGVDLRSGVWYGGFLLGAYQHILTQHTSKEQLFTDENGFMRGTLGDKITDERLWKQLKEKTFYGYDFDSTMVRIGLMNLILHGISNPNIDRRDTLSKNFNEDDKYDVILANPPFKGQY